MVHKKKGNLLCLERSAIIIAILERKARGAKTFELLQALLEKDPHRRMSLIDIYNHPYLTLPASVANQGEQNYTQSSSFRLFKSS